MTGEDASIYTGELRRISTIDYILFSLVFVLSTAIGFYHAYQDRKDRSAEHFHFGGKKMHPIPVSMSLTATFLSALTVLGVPAEVYTNGTMIMWMILGMFIATGAAAHLFVPVFFNLNKVSCFTYLQLRYGTVVRIMASVGFLIQTLIHMGFVLFAPSLAFAAVTGVSLWGSMIGVAAVCTLYTTLGGMKTVLWTDTLQLSIMIAGLLCVLILGSQAVGGFARAWTIANENLRIEFDDVSVDPRTRHSVWGLAIGGSLTWMYLSGISQIQVQRAMSLSTLKRSQIALWLNFPGLALVMILTSFIGVIMYAYYQHCDPVKYGLITRKDQLHPLFVLDVMGKYPGLSGIFLACTFSGSLSTLSSGLNAVSAIVLEDAIKLLYPSLAGSTKEVVISKVLVLFMGGVIFSIAVVLSMSKGLLLQFAHSLFSITAGPIFGVFVAGMFFPWTNQVGATSGLLLSIAFMFWLGFGGLVERPPSLATKLPLYTNMCNYNASGFATAAPPMTTVTSSQTMSAMPTTTTEEPMLYDFYRISYAWYTCLGSFVCIFLSVVISFMTGYTRANTVDSRLMCPFFEIIFPCLPESIKNRLRFGVNYDAPSTDDRSEIGDESRQTGTTKLEAQTLMPSTNV